MAVTSGIIDTALHPPLGLLTNLLDGNGPYGAGNHELTTWLDGATVRNVSDTFGALVIFNGAIPPKLGRTPGFSPSTGVFDGEVFEDRLIQVVVQHQLLLGLGGFVTTNIFDLHAIASLILWSEALPGRLGLYVAPGCSFDLQFLRVPI